ncbi:lysozyme [Clostridium sp. OF10-22XD]|nr:lysozyme [Clostridium sp. OF10-22XD]
MKTNTAGINLIKKYEGCVLTAYRCPAGVLTIGYGHTGTDVKEDMIITKAQAEKLLKADLIVFEKKVSAYDSIYHFNANQFSALVSFAYNIGSIDQLTAKGTRSLEEISKKMLLYNKAAGKQLPGLVKRRKAEQELFNKKATKTNTAKTDEAAKAAGYKIKVTTPKAYTLEKEHRPARQRSARWCMVQRKR